MTTLATPASPRRAGRHTRRLAWIVPILVFTAAGCAAHRSDVTASAGTMAIPGLLPGFVAQDVDVVSDSLRLLPPPPAEGSKAFALDQEIYRTTRSLRGTARWDLAAQDANLGPTAVETYSCALGVQISEATTPELTKLMRRMLPDAGRATGPVKDHYGRKRPFVVNQEASCTPADEAHLAKNGSYPSGHTSIGWAWALVLAELAPDRAGEVLRRGYAFGDSRIICGAHWYSDVNAGRVIGAAAVARVHAEPEFLEQLELARTEVAAARAKGVTPKRDCAAEAAALALEPGGAN